jgi:hypothetical protein
VAGPAVFGSPIPIIGLAGVGYLVLRAIRDDGEDEE